MSMIATAAAASATPALNLVAHGHKKGGHGGKDGTASSSTQGPATTQSLLSSLFESIEQVIGVSLTAPQRAASAVVPAAGAVTAAAGTGATTAAASPTATPGAGAAASATPASAQDAQSFLHSLFQALKADGLGASAGASASASAANAAPGAATRGDAASGTGRYDASLASSLQSLIHQIASNGPSSATTSNLSASFDTLIQGAHGSAAVAGGGASPPASLQEFLGNLLQSVQSKGIHSFTGIGANVDAKV
jgi:hypothetical protein